MKKIILWILILSAAFAALALPAQAQQAETVCALGDRGEEVRALKARLQALGYFSKDTTVGGEYTESTVLAVRRFQAQNGLPETGEADARTLEALYADKAVTARATPRPAQPEYDADNPPPTDEEKIAAAVREALRAIFPVLAP